MSVTPADFSFYANQEERIAQSPQQTRAVLIYRAAALVLAASDIDNHVETCGSIRAGRILRKIADRMRDDATALRKQADARPKPGDEA